MLNNFDYYQYENTSFRPSAQMPFGLWEIVFITYLPRSILIKNLKKELFAAFLKSLTWQLLVSFPIRLLTQLPNPARCSLQILTNIS